MLINVVIIWLIQLTQAIFHHKTLPHDKVSNKGKEFNILNQ